MIMKNLFLILLCGSFLMAGNVAAQSSAEPAEAQTKRGPYLTNRFFDNIFIGVGGGVNIYHGNSEKGRSIDRILAPALDISLGKWITPSVGVRLQYAGLKAKGWTDSRSAYATGTPTASGIYHEKFNVSNLHGDFLWDISNAIGGYNAKRVWSFIPYVGLGWGRSSGNGTHANEIAATVGLLNNLRICDALDLTLEARHLFVNDRFDGVVRGSAYEGMWSVTAGLSFKFNRRGFKRAPQVVVPDYTPYTNKIQALENDLEAKENKIKALSDQLAAAQKQKPETVTQSEVAPMAIFFEIGKANLTDKEMINLGYIAEAIKKSPDKTFKVVGSADKATGSAKRNQQLSEMRAQAVYDALVNKFGVNPKQLKIVANGSEKEPFSKPVLNRVTIVR